MGLRRFRLLTGIFFFCAPAAGKQRGWLMSSPQYKSPIFFDLTRVNLIKRRERPVDRQLGMLGRGRDTDRVGNVPNTDSDAHNLQDIPSARHVDDPNRRVATHHHGGSILHHGSTRRRGVPIAVCLDTCQFSFNKGL